MNGALVLTIAALVAKALSALYRIPFQNIVGNTGFYVYQQIYPIYGIGMTFALNGLPVFISKLVAQAEDEERQNQLLGQIFVVLLGLAVVIFAGLQVGSGLIAQAMGDRLLQPLISSVSWMFLLMPFLAVARGYYQGTFNMLPTAISQVSEQLVRVTLIISVAVIASRHEWSVYRTGSWAMLGSVAGAVVAGGIFAGFWRHLVLHHPLKNLWQGLGPVAKLLIKDGMIICLFSALMVLLQLVDSFTVMNALQNYGLGSERAKFIKGIYDRGQPLVQLGMTVAISFASTLLPALTIALRQGKKQEYRKISLMMFHVGLALGSAATAGMIVLMPALNTLLFGDAQLSATISVYVLSVPLISVISLYNSVLQSTDNFGATLLAVLAAIVIKASCNSYLVSRWGIMGSAICTDLALVGALIVLVQLLPDSVRQTPQQLSGYLGKLAGCLLVMVVGVALLSGGFQLIFGLQRLSALCLTLLGSVAGVVLFGISAIKFQLLAVDEWATLPGGKRLVRLLKQK